MERKLVRIAVDNSKCSGHARCNATAPQVYPIDDDGYVALHGEVEVDDALLAQAEAGAAACPERAITIGH
jgi:ferredoxin